MYKNFLFIIFGIFFTFPSYSFNYHTVFEAIDQPTIKSQIKIDLLVGAGYLMWVCTNYGKNCSSSFPIGNGTTIEAHKGDTFYIGIASLPRTCDFFKVNKDNDFAVISYWGNIFNPYFNIYRDDVVHYMNRKYTYNIISGCPALQEEKQ